MAETNHSFSVQVHGNARGSEANYNIVGQVPGDTSTRKPNILAYLNFKATRSDTSNAILAMKVSGGLERLCRYTSGSTASRFDSFTGNYGSASYGYAFKVEVRFASDSTWRTIAEKPASSNKWTNRGYSVSVSDFTVTCAANTIPVYFRITGGCHPYEGCPEGSYEGRIGDFSVPAYNPETPATNASNGKIFSTNNSTDGSSGRAISDKPDKEVWWTWDGAIAGTPSNIHGIKQYNIDINTVNDVNGASSVPETQNYSKNTHISLFTLCKKYNIRVGGTLYCWVNTQENNDNWLRKSIFRVYKYEERWINSI